MAAIIIIGFIILMIIGGISKCEMDDKRHKNDYGRQETYSDKY